ncbi:MAG: hypothetical protein NWE98_01975 [Candidatus Bathyarchaeota archaeon]|nr:hypothetical protein [Candidatus Bathyarchaeota archaeon]
MTFNERMDFYSNRLTTLEHEYKEILKELSNVKQEIGILQQKLLDCQTAEKERNDLLKDSKNDWKWTIGLVLSLIALIVGWLR